MLFNSGNNRLPIFIGIIVGTVLVISLLVMGFSIINLSSELKTREDNIFSELGKNSESLDLLRQNILLLSADSNEIRRTLHFPEQNYPILDQRQPEDSETEESENILFYRALDYLEEYQINIETFQILKDFCNSELFINLLQDFNLIAQEDDSGNYILKTDDNEYFNVSFNSDKEKFILESYLGDEIEVEGVSARVSPFFQNNIEKLGIYYKSFKSSFNLFETIEIIPEVKTLLEERELNISTSEENTSAASFIRNVKNSDGFSLIRLSLNKKNLDFKIDDNQYSNFNDFLDGLIIELKRVDYRTLVQKQIDHQKIKLLTLLDDNSFTAVLQSKGLKVLRIPREDNDYYYYDIVDADGSSIGSYAVQKWIGEIYLMDNEDVVISALKTLSLSDLETGLSTKKKLIIPDEIPQVDIAEASANSITFLLCGSHENNADTIIVAHADSDADKITLISIPRDLYYEGRKINDFYRSFGSEQFSRVLSEILGLHIEKYIVIDMFAFIDAVNILGGIDITLAYDLIDPTYKIKENGIWSTLYYESGTHHLNGIQALRVARSRHYSSDFSRARRQQQILGSIKGKFAELDIGDVGKLYEFVDIFIKYVDTNFSPFELVDLFMKYRNSSLSDYNVIDTTNVLYQTWTNVYLLEDKQLMYKEGFQAGLWIVLPLNNDWNIIRWYVQKIIKGETI